MWQSYWKVEIPLIKVGLLRGKQKSIIFIFPPQKKKEPKNELQTEDKSQNRPYTECNLK